MSDAGRIGSSNAESLLSLLVSVVRVREDRYRLLFNCSFFSHTTTAETWRTRRGNARLSTWKITSFSFKSQVLIERTRSACSVETTTVSTAKCFFTHEQKCCHLRTLLTDSVSFLCVIVSSGSSLRTSSSLFKPLEIELIEPSMRISSYSRLMKSLRRTRQVR